MACLPYLFFPLLTAYTIFCVIYNLSSNYFFFFVPTKCQPPMTVSLVLLDRLLPPFQALLLNILHIPPASFSRLFSLPALRIANHPGFYQPRSSLSTSFSVHVFTFGYLQSLILVLFTSPLRVFCLLSSVSVSPFFVSRQTQKYKLPACTIFCARLPSFLRTIDDPVATCVCLLVTSLPHICTCDIALVSSSDLPLRSFPRHKVTSSYMSGRVTNTLAQPTTVPILMVTSMRLTLKTFSLLAIMHSLWMSLSRP